MYDFKVMSQPKCYKFIFKLYLYMIQIAKLYIKWYRNMI